MTPVYIAVIGDAVIRAIDRALDRRRKLRLHRQRFLARQKPRRHAQRFLDRGAGLELPEHFAAALAVGFFSLALINSTSRQSDCSSRISTLNDSGTPGSMAASPLTMAS